MTDRADLERPGSGLYASGGIVSPPCRFPLVGEVETEEGPVVRRPVDYVVPIQTVDGPGASRNMMIQATMKRET
jgi:hypothetical protein